MMVTRSSNVVANTAVIDWSQLCHTQCPPQEKNHHHHHTRKKPNPLNPLSQPVRAYILDRLQKALGDPAVTSIILTGGSGRRSKTAGGRTADNQHGHFSSGADLTELLPDASSSLSSLVSVSQSPTLHEVIDCVDASTKPIVAAIDGVCLGGGLELALACHFRIATTRAQLGLPEVHVGLIPGAGGTQRLPRLVGLTHALELILTGASVTAYHAREIGLMDHVVDLHHHHHHRTATLNDPSTNNSNNSNPNHHHHPNDVYALLLTCAHQWAAWAETLLPLPLLSSTHVLSRRRDIPDVPHPGHAHARLHTAHLQRLGNSPGEPAAGGQACQIAALEAIRAACFQPSFAAGLHVEATQFRAMLVHPEGVARRHMFFALRQAAAQQQRPRPPLSRTTTTINPSSLSTSTTPTPTSPLQRLLSSSSSSSLSRTEHEKVSVGVVGAGTMGCGIAFLLLHTRLFDAVWLVDTDPTALERGVGRVQSLVVKATAKATAKEKAEPSSSSSSTHVDATFRRLKSSTSLSDLCACALVVEVVIESLAVKQDIFKQLAHMCAPTTLLVSNTSTLSIDALAQAATTTTTTTTTNASASASASAARVAGWHFFSPAHLMKLVEIVRGSQTHVETLTTLQQLSKRMGKTSVVVGNCDGFCGNRMLQPYSAETALLLVEGGSIAQVDHALLEFGMKLGPFQMSDLAGNDVGYLIRVQRGWVRLPVTSTPPASTSTSLLSPLQQKRLPSPPDVPVPPNRPDRYTELVDDMVSKYGRLGQKVGKGWYDYPPTAQSTNSSSSTQPLTPQFSIRGVPSSEMNTLIQSYRISHTGPTYTNAYIIERVLFPLVNEGFKCLEEGIVTKPSDIDVVYVLGYGFPIWRGGPMHWANVNIGLPKLLHTLQTLSKVFPTTAHYVPSPLLVECVRLGVTVEEYYDGQKDLLPASNRMDRLAAKL